MTSELLAVSAVIVAPLAEKDVAALKGDAGSGADPGDDAAAPVWDAPPMTTGLAGSLGTYNFIQLTHVAIIAFAGIAGNIRLLQLLRELSGNPATARRVLMAWLAVNLFLGSQLSWILRPFIGSPNLPVEFLRAEAFHGNFYETVFHSLLNLLTAGWPTHA